MVLIYPGRLMRSVIVVGERVKVTTLTGGFSWTGFCGLVGGDQAAFIPDCAKQDEDEHNHCQQHKSRQIAPDKKDNFTARGVRGCWGRHWIIQLT